MYVCRHSTRWFDDWLCAVVWYENICWSHTTYHIVICVYVFKTRWSHIDVCITWPKLCIKSFAKLQTTCKRVGSCVEHMFETHSFVHVCISHQEHIICKRVGSSVKKHLQYCKRFVNEMVHCQLICKRILYSREWELSLVPYSSYSLWFVQFSILLSGGEICAIFHK